MEVTDLRLDFYDYESMHGFDHSNLIIDHILETYKPKIALEEKDWSIKGNLEYDILDPQSYTTLWYQKWEEYFMDTCKFASHELVDQPLLFFYLVSASDDDIDQEIQNMYNMKSSVKRYREGTYDSDYPHIFLILHDKSTSISFDVAMVKLDKLKKKYSRGDNHCEMWSMDFLPLEGNTGYDEWEKYLRLNRMPEKNVLELWDRSRLLSINDREACRYFIKDIIDERMIPYVARKIRGYEKLVKDTKKGFTNMMKSFLNKKERSENDGMKKDFVMNKQEVSMKSLVDLSFLFQDYKTLNAYLKYPMSDFKSIKAYKQVSSCLELQFFSYLLSYLNYADTKEFSQNLFQAANSYYKSKEPKWMIRNLIISAEMCKSLGKFSEAAKSYLKIAYSFTQSSWIPAIFFEQAAYCYLKIDQQRKFSFYIVKAGIIYLKFNYKDYSFFCFGISEPYYSKFKWNEIRNFLYTSLSESSFYFGNLQLSVKFFRNLLQLCCDIEDNRDVQTSQKECLNQFFSVVKNWNECREKQQDELIALDDMNESIINIGFLSLPKYIDDLLEIVLSHEIALPHIPEPPSSNNTWRMLIRQAMSHIETEEEKNAKNDPGVSVLYQSSRDEKFEIGLYDAANRFEKKTEALKKVRKVYAKESIVVKVVVKNPLMTNVEISNIFLKCVFVPKEHKKDENDSELTVANLIKDDKNTPDYVINQDSITLSPTSVKEIILEVKPMKEGEIFIQGIEWVLFNAVSCNYYFPTNYPNELANEENTSRKLKGRENMFHYEVLSTSANLQMFFDEKLSKMFYYTEYTDIDVTFLNESEHTIKDVYLKCSHPVFFGFACMKIVDEIPPQQQIKTKIWFRAVGYYGTQKVKFLSRYRVVKEGEGSHARTTRAVKEINIIKSFNFSISTANSEDDVRERILGVHAKDIHKILDRQSLKYMQINQIDFVRGSDKWVFSVKDDHKKAPKGTIEKYFSITPIDDDYEPPFGASSERRRSSSVLLNKNSEEEIDFTKPPYNEFIEQEYKFFKQTMKSIKEYDNNQLETASIAISWKIFKQGIVDIKGFQCIFGIVLNRQIISDINELENETSIDNPLVCLVNYEKIIQFDFSQNQF